MLMMRNTHQAQNSSAAAVPRCKKLDPPVLTKKELRTHCFFIRKKELKSHLKLMNLVKGKDLIIAVDVPGSPSLKYLTPSGLLTTTSVAVLKWFTTLHSYGWSIDGLLLLEDIFVTLDGAIAVQAEKIKHLKRSTIKRKKKDMICAANIIHDEILSGATDLPADTYHFLWLLRHFRSRYLYLLNNHPANLTEPKKLWLFECLYFRLKQLKKLDMNKYDRIISKMPYCEVSEGHWKLRSQKHEFLTKLLEHKSPQAAPLIPQTLSEQIQHIGPKYKDNGEGLLEVHKKGLRGLMDFSVVSSNPKVKGEKRKIAIFQYYQVEHMFGSAFPQVICKFQKAMHEEQEFEPLMWKDDSCGSKLSVFDRPEFC